MWYIYHINQIEPISRNSTEYHMFDRQPLVCWWILKSKSCILALFTYDLAGTLRSKSKLSPKYRHFTEIRLSFFKWNCDLGLVGIETATETCGSETVSSGRLNYKWDTPIGIRYTIPNKYISCTYNKLIFYVYKHVKSWWCFGNGNVIATEHCALRFSGVVNHIHWAMISIATPI